MRGLGWLLPAWLLLAGGGCSLPEVLTPRGDDLLVVEAVLRTDQIYQHLLLHRSLGDGAAAVANGAQVRVVTPAGREIVYTERALGVCLDGEGNLENVAATCYASDPREGRWVVPGAEYELRIDTPDGRRLRGRTQVPGAFTLRDPPPFWDAELGVGGCTLAPGAPLPLVWSVSEGAWTYIADLEIFGLRAALGSEAPADVPEPVKLTGLAISERDTTLVLPTDFGIFQRTEYDASLLLAIRDGFPAGVRAHLLLAAADRNYVNAIRGGTFNPSGQVRTPSVVGDGVGAFGSLVPLTLLIQVEPGEAESPCPRP